MDLVNRNNQQLILHFVLSLSNSVLNCDFGEDEEECDANGRNHETVNEIRAECNSTGSHVMCPHTLICISHDWLWYGSAKHLKCSPERKINFLFSVTVMMTAEIIQMKHIVASPRIVPTINLSAKTVYVYRNNGCVITTTTVKITRTKSIAQSFRKYTMQVVVIFYLYTK